MRTSPHNGLEVSHHHWLRVDSRSGGQKQSKPTTTIGHETSNSQSTRIHMVCFRQMTKSCRLSITGNKEQRCA